MGIKDRVEKYAEDQVQERMRPAVAAMNRLEKKIDALTEAIKENTKALREKK